jgi:hypothetical protein
MVIPSSSWKGLSCMISRSLKVPGSLSSALQTTYAGSAESFGMKLALRPIGKAAPPRPRRPERTNW